MQRLAFTFGLAFGLLAGFGVGHYVGSAKWKRVAFDQAWTVGNADGGRP